MNLKELQLVNKFDDGDSSYFIRYNTHTKEYIVSAIWMEWQSNREEIEGTYDNYRSAMEKIISIFKTNLDSGCYDFGVADA